MDILDVSAIVPSLENVNCEINLGRISIPLPQKKCDISNDSGADDDDDDSLSEKEELAVRPSTVY